MIETDRKLIKLNLFHPSSSLVITNPNNQLALIFEVPKFNIIRQITVKQKINQLNQPLSSVLFGVTTFEITPMRGIILPNDSQLIKVKAQMPHANNTKTLSKAKKKGPPLDQEVAQLDINCSYFLEYNKQKIVRSQQNSTKVLSAIENLSKNEKYHINIWIQKDNLNGKESEIANVRNSSKLIRANEENLMKEGQIIRSKSLIESFKRKIGQIDLNTLKSSNYLKDLREKEQANFQNPKLNDDYDLVRNKITLSDIQQKKQNQLFKLFEKQTNKISSPEYKIKISNQDPTAAFNKQTKQQGKRKDGIITPPFLKKNQTIDESIVVQSFQPQFIPALNKPYESRVNNRSIELIALAILAAIFVSLGANFKMIFYQ